ncbi:hypothetical protein [Neoroseomonas rubea]|uniref:hypothetical protein n=1 Tax=Neoroseomonas rubea TaxID=2748666 RepID=UPI0018DF6157|nr:hypothetical protein [Roseomonas rubea]
MPIVVELIVGHGVKIDTSDIWLLKEVIQDGTAAVVVDPAGKEVTLVEDIAYRAAPGLRLSVMPATQPERIRLVIEAFIPLIHRYPPRNNKPGAKNQGAPTS